MLVPRLSTLVAILSVLFGSSGLTRSAVIEDVLECFSAYAGTVAQNDQLSNGNYGESPNWDAWQDGMSEASIEYGNCLRDVLTPYGLLFPFHYAAGTGSPSGLVYNFQNAFPSGETVYLTVFNAEGQLSLVDASIEINGTEVVTSSDLQQGPTLDVPILLAPGQNEVRIDAGTTEIGSLVVAIDVARFSPPN